MLLLSLKGCHKEKKLEAMTVAGEGIGLIGLYLFYIPNRFIRPSIELLNQPGFTGSFLYARTYNGRDRHRNMIPLHPYRVTKEQTRILDSLEQHSHTWPTQGPQCSGGPEVINTATHDPHRDPSVLEVHRSSFTREGILCPVAALEVWVCDKQL